ncbi:condensation domain protein [Mycobacterium intracellulare 1956]|uniref:Condensation domain protein n=1 Tax=Mycobacterium intracellulare 1956 TaxID=1299331 RepID=X8CUT0_MYCIT|nr:condensation domain protein [Mycobacterium intracellulare 1956]
MSAWLPEYMVPTHIVALEEFPMTTSGKLDRKALPAPDYQDADRYRAPATAVEEILVGIYAQVLGLERVGVDDSFFDLGGDSLSAMRLIAAVNTSFNSDLGVRAVFEAPTVAELALLTSGDADRPDPLVAGERPAVIPLSFAQTRLWFIDQFQGASPMYNITVALRLRGHLDADALAAALADVVGRHETLRTVFASADGIPQQVVVPAERIGFACDVIDARVGGRRTGCGRAWRRPPGTPSTCRTKAPCTPSFSPSATTNTCWWSRCTTSPPTGGRSPRSRATSESPTRAAARGRPPTGRPWRCNTSTTRCGSAHISGTWTTATAASPPNWITGRTRWPGCPNACSCPPIGPTRRSPTTAAPGWRWTGRPSYSNRSAGSRASTTPPASW